MYVGASRVIGMAEVCAQGSLPGLQQQVMATANLLMQAADKLSQSMDSGSSGDQETGGKSGSGNATTSITPRSTNGTGSGNRKSEAALAVRQFRLPRLVSTAERTLTSWRSQAATTELQQLFRWNPRSCIGTGAKGKGKKICGSSSEP